MEDIEIVKVRAERAGFECKDKQFRITYAGGESAEVSYLSVEFPNGRNRRTVNIHQEAASTINSVDFENWTFLGEYAAIFDKKEKTIEALVRTLTPVPLRVTLQRIAQKGKEKTNNIKAPEVDIEPDQTNSEKCEVHLPLEGGSGKVRAEIGDASAAMLATEPGGVRPGGISLKVTSTDLSTHDDALSLLRELSTSLFFELDLTHQISLALQTSSTLSRIRQQRSRRGQRDLRPPQLPRMKYSPEAASLYTYGRSAAGMPLLEFLAYYQVMEFYFPVYSRIEVMQRIRQELLDPRFDPSNDSDLARILNTLGGGTRALLAETEQLRATIRRCVDDATLSDFIKQDSGMEQFLTGKQELTGVKSINFNNRDQRITDQVADRLYQIRCRIVHSKEDGGPTGTQILLPFGEEARKLSMDIAVARFVAQKVLIAGGRPAAWT